MGCEGLLGTVVRHLCSTLVKHHPRQTFGGSPRGSDKPMENVVDVGAVKNRPLGKPGVLTREAMGISQAVCPQVKERQTAWDLQEKSQAACSSEIHCREALWKVEREGLEGCLGYV